jgi:hypothetical protein
MLTPPIFYCLDLAIAEYMLTLPDRVHVDVLLLYDNFSYIKPPPLQAQKSWQLVNFTFEQEGHALQNICNGTACPMCKGLQQRGRWVVHSSNISNALRVWCTNPPSGCDHRLRALVTGSQRQTELDWIPYSCQYKEHTEDTKQQCASSLSKPVCFIGDSQLRHLHGLVAHMIDPDAPGSYLDPIKGPIMAANKGHQAVVPSKKVLYFEDQWGKSSTPSNCSLVFRNFGQWAIAYTAGVLPWSPMAYADQVEQVAKNMALERDMHGTAVHWLTINSAPMSPTRQLNGTDWRTDPMFNMFNAISTNAMQRHRIPVIDMFAITDPVNDLTYDATHFMGVVGHALARQIASVVCPA